MENTVGFILLGLLCTAVVGISVAVMVVSYRDEKKLKKNREHREQMDRWLKARPMDTHRSEGYDHLAKALAVGVITPGEHDKMMELIAGAETNAEIRVVIESVEIVERPE